MAMPWLTAFKKLGHRFKKRRVVSTFLLVWLYYLKKLWEKGERSVQPQTLLIVRFDLIGDYLLFRNLLKPIREKYPNYRITLCGNSVFKDLAENLDRDCVDEFIWIDRRRFLKDKAYHYNILTKLYAAGYETAFQPTYSRELYGDLLVYASQAPVRVGVAGDYANQTRKQRLVSDAFYTRLLQTDPAPMFEFYRNKKIIEAFTGLSAAPVRPELVIPNLKEVELPAGDYAVLVPGASHRQKRWRFFYKAAQHLKDRYGLQLVFVGRGKEDQKAIDEAIRQAEVKASYNLCNQTTLLQLAQILKNACLVLANDTAAVHMAAAVGAPTVCISIGAHAYRFNHYPAEMGRNIEFVFPQEIEALLQSGEFQSYQSRYNNELDINSISLSRVLQAVEKVRSRATQAD